MAVPTATVEKLERVWHEPSGLVSFLTTVEHTRIGIRYLVTASIFFCVAGIEALFMRTQLAQPRSDFLDPNAFNQLFSMHGFTMIFLFATPILAGFGNYFVPIMIGARDMAFPRVNAFSYWTFAATGAFVYFSFFLGDPPDAGWFNYVPIASREYNPGPGIDFYNLGLIFLAISVTGGAINFIVTMFRLRAPGMSVNRMPLFCWAVLVQSFAIVFAVPSLTAGNILLELQRTFDWPFFDVARGGDPVLWQHLFWIFGHPDVYIIVLPALGIVSTIIPIYARNRMLAFNWVIFATVATGIIGFGVWVHHMFALGLPMVSLAFFAAVSMVITIPSGIQFFAWLGTMLGGRPVLKTPMLWIVGFLITFVIGGVTGVMFAAIPFDIQVTDSYFVVAHFHYVLFGGAVFPVFAGIFHWLPKMSGRMYPEPLGHLSFWLVFIGFNVTFFPMHISGLLGMPRRIYTYAEGLGWDGYNLLSTLGSYVLGLGILTIVVTVVWTLLRGRPAGADPWGGDTLEWTVSSPPPDYTFAVIPTVTSAHPAWDRTEADLPPLTEGHEQPGSTVLDGEPDEVFEMPESSIWPFATMLSLTVLFAGLIAQLWVMAIIGGALVLGALAGWHRPKEELVAQ